MKRIILLAAAIANTVAAADQQTFTGTITDTICGKSHEMIAGQTGTLNEKTQTIKVNSIEPEGVSK
ncbi:MAG TPA: hypothetical protein VKX49_16380 [Bryobacteraceae bacterium]|nr:hypothetical protein [Bryobacteraceae bacterium]